jgi:membrane protease YdiL (CAAX protease family)
MTFFDPAQENDPPESSDPRPPHSASDSSDAQLNPDTSAESLTGDGSLPGDPIGYPPDTHPASLESKWRQLGKIVGEPLPEAVRAPWSWGHFLVFTLFTCISFIVVQTALAIYYAPQQKLSKEQYEHYFMGNARFVVASTVICSALIFLFLYVTISVLRDLPFWNTLGWRSLQRDTEGRRRNPLAYFFLGFGLAIFVGLAGTQVHTKEGIPLQELFKNRETALVFMAMAVFVAPLVEETVFRGYLFPLFAKSFGIAPGILLTGVLFGLMHGYQLGWTWGIVALLILVGVIFTFTRARTGTVLASFLMHLGYNSMIAASAIISTHGFTRLPAGP